MTSRSATVRSMCRTLCATAMCLVVLSGGAAAVAPVSPGPSAISLTQVLAVALESGTGVRTAKSAATGAHLDLEAARRNAGPQVTIGSTGNQPAFTRTHEDNNPFTGLDLPGYGLADTSTALLGASLELPLFTGGAVTLGYTYDWNKVRLVNSPGSAEESESTTLTSLRLRQPLFRDPHLLSPQIEVAAAERQVTRAELALRRVRRNTYVQVSQAFFAVLRAQDEVAVAEDQVKLLQDALAKSEALAKIDYAGSLDVADAQIALARGRLASAKSAQTLSLAKLQLANAIGSPVPENARALPVESTGSDFALEAVATAESAASVDVALCQLSVEEADTAVGRAGIDRGLQFDLNGVYNDDATWSVGLAATWSPTRDAALGANVRRARQELVEAQAALIDARNNAGVSARQDYYDYTNTREELAIADLGLDRAKREYELTQRRAAAGSAAERDVLAALVTLGRARNDRNAAYYNWLGTAAKIEAASGRFDH